MRGHRLLLLGVAVAALCAWCGWVSVFHRSTASAEITWVLSLGAVVVVDLALWLGKTGRRFGWHLEAVDNQWPRPDRGRGWLTLQGLAPWIVLFLVALAWDVLGIDTGPHQPHLTISALAQAYRPLNAGLLLVWMLAGIGYGSARARAPVGAPIIPNSSGTTYPESPRRGAALGAGLVSLPGHPITLGLLLPSSPSVGVAFWIAVPVAGLLVDLWARHSDGRVANAGEVIRVISAPKVANVVLIAAWAFAGYHLFAR